MSTLSNPASPTQPPVSLWEPLARLAPPSVPSAPIISALTSIKNERSTFQDKPTNKYSPISLGI